MQLIGLLDSPYVRRAAIGLLLLELPFEHRPVSVFRGFDEFSRINPVVKAPTLVCDDGGLLMDSTLILDYAQALAGDRRRLLPTSPAALQPALQLTGLALAACEKSVQIVYEHMLRPAEHRDAPWLGRVRGQLRAACDALEAAVAARPPATGATTIDGGGLAAAVAWTFLQSMTPDDAPAARCPRLAAFTAEAESLPAFRAAPHGDGQVQA